VAILEITLVALFILFFAGTVFRILAMRERKRSGGDVDRARLVFFFLGCLMLVCMIPLRLFELLTGPVLGADLSVVGANFLGYALTYDFGRPKEAAQEDEANTVRAYQVYYRGRPFGMMTKEGIDTLLAHNLLMKQHTVELVEDFKSQAESLGIGIVLLRNRDGDQTLIRVTPPS
jgi:hypothetical protein